ncbi:MAG TPA: hypothetical protein DCM05_05290 [Elusimicrobia bacterium]|nr:hypothetical protein [Elusimicrobiota bacterium]
MNNAAGVLLCWSCKKALDPQDRYCRFCGMGQGEHVAWYYRPWGIALATLFGLGPFGLILVWRSPKLGTKARWAWTAAVVLAGAFILHGCYTTWLMIRSLMPDLTQLGQLPY